MKVKSTTLRNEEEMLAIRAEKLERIIDYYDLLLSTYHSLNEQTRGFNTHGNKAISGIVTFEKNIGVMKALKRIHAANSRRSNSKMRYQCRRFFCYVFCCTRLPRTKADTIEGEEEEAIPKFQGMNLKCEPAPAPSTILWENLEYGCWSQFTRQFVATLVVAIAICASFGATIGAAYYRNELKTIPLLNCNSTIDEVTLTSGCQCAAYPYSRVSSAIFSSSDVCHEFWTEQAPLFAFTIFATAVVSFVNFIVGYTTISLSPFERHHSLVSKDFSVAIRLFIAFSFNTVFVYIIVNVLLGVNNTYDLSESWFSEVGQQILITMLINIVFPHLSILFEVFLSYFVLYCGDKPLLQREMNERYVGPEYPFAVRSAQIFMQAFICLIFGPGLPLLYPISMLSFFLFFYVDKWAILRFYRTPPEYDSQMSELLVIILWIGLFGHLCFAIWCLSVPGLFWNDDNIQNMTYGDYFLTRITLIHVLPLLIGTFFIIGLWIGSYTICLTWKRFSSSVLRVDDDEDDELVQLKEDLPPLYDAKSSGYLRGLKSYNILQNPLYRRAFGVPKVFCDEHSHVASVVALPGGDVVPELAPHIRKAAEEY